MALFEELPVPCHDTEVDFLDTDRIRLVTEGTPHGADWHFANFSVFRPAELWEAGVRHLLWDLDGTLAPAYHHRKIPPEVVAILREVDVIFDSSSLGTNSEVDLRHVQEAHGFDFVFTPPGSLTPEAVYKPDRGFFVPILATLAVPPETIAFVGDNPVHDIEGAAAMGMWTVLVDRLDPYGFFAEAA